MSKPGSHAAPASADDDPPLATTLHVRDNCMCLHLQRAARAVARRFDEALRPVGLTNGQFSLLMSLNRPHPPVMGEVASLLAMDRTTLTAMLKPLVRRGFIAVEADARDRRSRRLRLLPDGKATLRAAVPIWIATEAEVERGLAGGDADRLRAELRDLS